MSALSSSLQGLRHCARKINRGLLDLVELFRVATKPRSALVAENLFLRSNRRCFRSVIYAVRLARRACGGQAGYANWMASPRARLVLALELEANGKTGSAQTSPS